MNYLAHIYLSDNQPELQIGNFIADSVKGRNHADYPESIQNGILIHRKIDSFTDSHQIIRDCKRKFIAYGHYSGVVTDIIFDHFLAKNWSNYHQEPLLQFTNKFYLLLENNMDILPARVQQFYPVMKKHNWLLKYQTIAGISDILYQMNIRTRNISKMNYSVIELREHYEYLEAQFALFFNELEHYAMSEIKLITAL